MSDEKWQRVAPRIGVRKAGRDKPCPDPSDPATIVAMLEWLVRRGYISFHRLSGNAFYWEHRAGHGSAENLHIALIDAIDALPEEP